MYDYKKMKKEVFKEKNQKIFLSIRDRASRLLEKAGAVTMGALMKETGDNWIQIACVDRLVELGELREISQNDIAGQDRIFVRP